MKLRREAYVAVRQCLENTYEWLDISTVHADRETTQALAALLDKQIPSWAKANPVVRIARCTITEEHTP